MGLLVLVLVIGAAGWFAWRAFVRERDRIAAQLRTRNRKSPEAMTLERDPETGVYRDPEDRR